MYAVIFRAQIASFDDNYHLTAARMRELAIDKYGCLEFTSVSDGENEISISYWENERQIENWKNDNEHKKAQERGKRFWYRSYNVQVVEIKRAYEKR